MTNIAFENWDNTEVRRESLACLVASAFSGIPSDEISDPEQIDLEIADRLIIFINAELEKVKVEMSKKVVAFVNTEIDTYLHSFDDEVTND